jgi:hypothetical protein
MAFVILPPSYDLPLISWCADDWKKAKMLSGLLERIRINRGGDTNLLAAFLDPDDLPAALEADGPAGIEVLQDERESYLLPL